MRRDVLITAVGKAAGELGYAFHTGPDSSIPARAKSLPTMWLSPPKLISTQGRNECRSVYSLNIYLMMAATPQLRADADPALDVLEYDAVEIFHRLGCDPNIVRTFNMRSAALDKPLTKNGEIAIVVEMDAELFYCR